MDTPFRMCQIFPVPIGILASFRAAFGALSTLDPETSLPPPLHAEPAKPSRREAWGRWVRANHAVVSSVATAVSALIAAVAIVVAGLSLLGQGETNRLVQQQLRDQANEADEQRARFVSNRGTELARIVFDTGSTPALKSYALKELLGLDHRIFGKNGYEEDDAKQRWAKAAQDPDPTSREQRLIAAARWRCEEHHDTGGGSGNTVRRMVDLRGAKLAGVDLSDTHVTCANLSGADLSGADLQWTHFSSVVMDDVDLSGADLEHAAMFWTYLRAADPSEEELAAINGIYGEHIAINCIVRGSPHRDSPQRLVGLDGEC
jgi:hypothetical protein